MSGSASVPIDLIVFDLDGVLVDSSACHAAAFGELWQRCGIRGPGYDEIAGRTTRDAIERVTAPLGPTPAQIEEWVAFKQARTLELFESREIAFADSISGLEALRAAGYDFALGTGASRERALLVLERLGCRGWFSAVVAAEDVTRGKPDPETYRLAVERAGGTPDLSIVVEDSASGIESGLAAGARVACVRSGLQADHERFVGSYDDLRGLAGWFGVTIR